MICPKCGHVFKDPGRQKGGQTSRRVLTKEDAQRMNEVKKEKAKTSKELYYLCECGIKRRFPTRCRKCGEIGVPMMEGNRVIR